MVGQILNNLGVLAASAEHYREALDYLQKSLDIDETLIDRVLGFTSEKQKLQYLEDKEKELAGFMSLAADHLSDDAEVRRRAGRAWLRRKGIVLEAQKRFQEALVFADDSEAAQVFQELSRVRARLSRLAFQGPGPEGLEEYRRRMSELEAQRDALEGRLSRLSEAFAAGRLARSADPESVARSLPAGTVLVDFARLPTYDFTMGHDKDRWGPPRYLAFILAAGDGGQVGLVDLGPAAPIEEALTQFKRDVMDVEDLAGSKALADARQLHDLVFAPLRSWLGQAREIFVSPDGGLNLAPFEVMRGPDGRFLIEDYQFNYLSTGRDVLTFGRGEKPEGKAVLMGNPDFDVTPQAEDAARRRLGLPPDEAGPVLARSVDLRDLHFTSLPETGVEVRAIGDILGSDAAEVYMGAEVMEGVLRQKKAPRILHLATHGFFLDDRSAPAAGPAEGERSASESGEPRRARFENPLRRSGLALAGANYTLEREGALSSGGLLTAEKVLGLNLRGTELVVLSACETGLGEVRSGEGVFGLRRAFLQAGTRGLVMSLWSVPDRETRELMVDFYQGFVKDGLPRGQALRRAALGRMAAAESRYGGPNPLFWGAFVYMGQP